jgi:ribonuclease HI
VLIYQIVWEKSAILLNCNLQWDDLSLMECMDAWVLNKQFPKRLLILTCWFIWKERNNTLFDDLRPNDWVVVYKILDTLNIYSPVSNAKGLRLSSIIRMNGYAIAFFDGVALAGGSIRGAGGAIKCPNSQAYRWFFNCGDGTNTKDELLGAWATLTISKLLDLQYIQVLGDSKVVIQWLEQKGKLQTINTEGWKSRIKELIPTFKGIHFQHIFREANGEADQLSKQALTAPKEGFPISLGMVKRLVLLSKWMSFNSSFRF